MEAAQQHLEQYVEVEIGSEKYALPINDIHEIIKMQEITDLPTHRAYLKGVINLRGRIVPVISLRSRFGMEEAAYTKWTSIVVVNYMNENIGIIVDRVNRVTTFLDIQDPPDQIDSEHGYFFSGIGRTEDYLVSILKLDRVLEE